MVLGSRVRVVGRFPQALRCFLLSYAEHYEQLKTLGSSKPDIPEIRNMVKRHSDIRAEGIRAALILHQSQLHDSLRNPLMQTDHFDRCEYFIFVRGLMAIRPSENVNTPPFPSTLKERNQGGYSWDYCEGFPITRPGIIDPRNRVSFGIEEVKAFLGKNLYEQAGRRGKMIVANLRKHGGGYASLDELCTTFSSLFELLSPRLHLVGSKV